MEKKNKLKKMIAKGVSVAALSAALAGPLVGCDTTVGPALDPKDGPTMTDHNGVEFGISPEWTQEEVFAKLETATAYLSAGALDLKGKYAAIEADLRSNIGKDDYDTTLQIQFVESVQTIENAVSDNYQSRNIEKARFFVGKNMDILTDALCAEFGDQGKAALFRAQVKAFQAAHVLDQREYYFNDADKAAAQAEFAELAEAAEDLGSAPISTSSMFGALHTLDAHLRGSMPESCGEHREMFIRQFEDAAQFDGWIQDLGVLGYDLILPRTYNRHDNTITMDK